MERLTETVENFPTYVGRLNPYKVGLVAGELCAPPNTEYSSRDIIREIMTTLAAYEDTGLTPTDISTIRNELCLKCGRYKMAHEGSCNGCRWKKGE
jgi:hypothetical protein